MSLAASSGFSVPLRVLCVVANPTDAPHFDAARVWEDLSEGMRCFTDQGTAVVEQLADPTENGLRKELARAPWNVVHFVAHAQERKTVHWAALTLQSADGTGRNLTASYLADLFHGIPSLKYLVLQACDEACCLDALAGTLIEKGLTAVALPPLRGQPAQTAVEKLYKVILANVSAGELEPQINTSSAAEVLKAQSGDRVSAKLITPPPVPQPVPEPAQPVGVFYSYAHEDEELRDALEKHLSLLQRNGLIVEWHDRRISAGSEWSDEIDSHVRTAQIILLLISADFLASDYCYGIEMKIALERHASNDAIVIPIILRPVDWSDASFSHLEALPRDAKPITTWNNRDEALADVARGIRESLGRVYTRARIST
jgi:hypothetical protein